MEDSVKSRSKRGTPWCISRANGNVIEQVGNNLIVECTSNTYQISSNLVKRGASKPETPSNFQSQSLALRILENMTTKKVLYAQLVAEMDCKISNEIDDRILDFMGAIAGFEPDISKKLFNDFFETIQFTKTLEDTLSFVKTFCATLAQHQLESDLSNDTPEDSIQQGRNVILIDEDSGSECSLPDLNIDDQDHGVLLLRSDSISPTIDLAEEDEHKGLSDVITNEEEKELVQNKIQPEPSLKLERLSLEPSRNFEALALEPSQNFEGLPIEPSQNFEALPMESSHNFEALALSLEKQPYPSLQSTLLEWLIQHYYRPKYNITCSEQYAWNVMITMRKLSIDIETLYETFKGIINQGLSMDYFSSFLMSIKGFSDSEDKLLIADLLDPILAFLVASLLPSKVLTRGLQNVLKVIKVDNGWNRNIGIVSDLASKLGVIVSDVGYVFFDKKMTKTSGVDKIHQRNLVFFNARLFSHQDLTWGVATKVCRVYEEAEDYETTQKLLKPRRRPAIDVDIGQRHANLIRGFNHFAFEKALIEEFSRRIFNRRSIDVLITDPDVSKSLEGLTFYLTVTFGGTAFNANAAVKSNLYTSVWARLGFTETHLSIDYQFLYSFGGESCVFNSWLCLLYLIELPQSVNPLELIRLTISYFMSKENLTGMNYFLDFDKFNSNRAIIENLVDELMGYRTSRNPIVLEPFQGPSERHPTNGKAENEGLLGRPVALLNPFRQNWPTSNFFPRFQHPNPPFSANLPLPTPTFNGFELHPPLPFAGPQRPLVQTPGPFINPHCLTRPPTSLVFAPNSDPFVYRGRPPRAGLRTILVETEGCLGNTHTLPIDPNGYVSLASLMSTIPGASTMKYRLGDGPWQQVGKFRENFLSPPGGWEHYSYLVL